MTHNDDQCVQCVGTRVDGSTLCKDCLIALVNTYAPAQDIADARIKKIEEDLRKSKEIIERLLDHISAEAIYTMELRSLLILMEKETIGGNDDGEQRSAANKRK